MPLRIDFRFKNGLRALVTVLFLLSFSVKYCALFCKEKEVHGIVLLSYFNNLIHKSHEIIKLLISSRIRN